MGLFISPYGRDDYRCSGDRCNGETAGDGSAVPAIIQQEHYHTCVQNPKGLVARSAVTCRSRVAISNPEQLVEGVGSYHTIAELNDGSSTLYMIPCSKDSECRVACGRHGRTQRFYVCMKPYQLYDHMISASNGGTPIFMNETTPLGAAKNAPFDPTPGLSIDGRPLDGVCVDYKYAYQYNCGDETTSIVANSMTQCADNWHVEFWFCGVSVRNTGGDFTTTSVDWTGVLAFPRRLTSDVTCFFPGDCQTKCQLLRNAGTPSEACTFCYTPCPVNIISTLSTLVTAIYHDVYQALYLTVKCFADGIVSCVCTAALMLEPRWLHPDDHRYTDKQKCYYGEPLELLASQIGSIALQAIHQWGNSVGDAFSHMFGGGGNALQDSSATRVKRPDCMARPIAATTSASSRSATPTKPTTTLPMLTARPSLIRSQTRRWKCARRPG
jgi:hypothetical protein